MSKVNLNSVTSGFASTTLINANSTAITNAIENTLSRDGTGPNQMLAPLDMNGNLILNQANPITVSGFNWEGSWIASRTYQVGDVVESNNSSYICIVEHTSNVFATDLSDGKWQVVASSAALPAQSGNDGKILTTDGSNASWADVNTLALPITGGTLTGGLTGTTVALSGGLTGTSAALSSTLTVGSTANITGATTIGGLLTLSETAGIKGTVNSNNANAGSVGEYKSSTILSTSAVNLSSAVSANVTTLDLSAGDWDVDGIVQFVYGATTSITSLFGSISTASNTMTGFAFSHRCAAFVPGSTPMGYTVPKVRIITSVPITIYLVAVAGFTVSTCGAYGSISARRVR
jgi:hypothetical protein